MRYGRSHNVETADQQKRKLKAKPLLVLVGILLLFNLFWFIAWLIPDKSKSAGEEVASIDGESITREVWMAAMEKEIGRETLLELVNDKVMEAAAKKNGIEVSDKEIDLELALIHSVDNQAYTGLDAEAQRQKIRSMLILEKVLAKDVVIEDKAIKSNFKENASLYNIKTAYRTAIIVINSKEEAEQVVNEASNGSSFAILAKERSIDTASANLGGDIGYINESTENVDKEIVVAASNMKEDTTSDAISLSDGTFAVVQVSDRIKGRTFKYKEVKDHIKRELALEQLPESVSPEAFWEEFDTKWFYGE